MRIYINIYIPVLNTDMWIQVFSLKVAIFGEYPSIILTSDA